MLVREDPRVLVKKAFFLILIGALLVGNLKHFSINLVAFKNVAVLPAELAIGGLSVFLLIEKLRTGRLFVPNAVLAGAIGLFLLTAIISLLVNGYYYNLHSYEVQVAAAYLARWVLYCIPYFMAVDLTRSRRELEWVWRILAAGVTAFAALGVIQALLLPNFAFIVYPEAAASYDWDVQKSRLVSTFLDPNFAGCLIAMALSGSLAFLEEGYRKAWRWCGLFALALLLTFSRGAILAFLVAFLCLLLSSKNKRRHVAAVVLVSLILIAAAPYIIPRAEEYGRFSISDDSAQSRVDGWRLCVEVIRDNPVFGIGFNTTPYVVPRSDYNWHNGYSPVGASSFEITGGLLTIFYLSGILGLAAYCYLYGKVLWMAHFVATHSKDALFRPLGRTVFACTVVFVVNSFFTLSILYVFLMGLTWTLYGVLNFAYVKTRQDKLLAARALGSPAAVRGCRLPTVPFRAPQVQPSPTGAPEATPHNGP